MMRMLLNTDYKKVLFSKFFCSRFHLAFTTIYSQEFVENITMGPLCLWSSKITIKIKMSVSVTEVDAQLIWFLSLRHKNDNDITLYNIVGFEKGNSLEYAAQSDQFSNRPHVHSAQILAERRDILKEV